MANIYSSVEVATMKRSTFNRKVPHKTSLPFGKWIPIGKVQEILPHDTWRLDAKGIIRMLTPIVPIMDDVSFDVVSFFVPYTIMWNKAKQFFGENDQVAWDLPANVDFPKVSINVTAFCIDEADEAGIAAAASQNLTAGFIVMKKSDGSFVEYKNEFSGTILEYLGVPIHYNQAVLSNIYNDIKTNGYQYDVAYSSLYFRSSMTFAKINALPFRADQLIYNNWFRNNAVTDPIKTWVYDDYDTTKVPSQFALRRGVRWKDLFTACLPEPQRGPSVSIPLQGNADVGWINIGSSTQVAGGTYGALVNKDTAVVGAFTKANIKNNGNTAEVGSLKADLSSVTAATINQIRYAFATQRYYEKLARGGALYRDYIRVMFGVTPADLSIQIPQLLGSKHFHININQVLSTAETLDSNGEVSNPVGSTGAVSATGFADHIFTNSFSQHGLIMTYICIRKEHTYCQGLDKFWTKDDVFDLYNPTFAHIGEVGVETQEVYYDPVDGGTIKNTDFLGYNEAWYEYRYDRPVVTGLLNPLNPGSGQLSAFTLVDVLESAPTLDDNFVMEDPNGLDRSLVAGADFTDQFVADLLCDYTCTRVMPVHSTPGLLDHF